MWNKRGQLTLFIIIAILIVAVVVLYFVFRDNVDEVEGVPVEFAPIYDYVLTCLETTIYEGVEYISERGGYYTFQGEPFLEYFVDDFAYYYFSGQNFVPSIEHVEEELNEYVSDRMKYCINFTSLEERGYEIKDRNVSAKCHIKEGEIRAIIDYPVYMVLEEDSIEIRNFETTVISDVKDFIETSDLIVNEYTLNPGVLCLSCLEDYSLNSGFQVSSIVLNEEDVYLFSIKENYEEGINWRFVLGK